MGLSASSQAEEREEREPLQNDRESCATNGASRLSNGDAQRTSDAASSVGIGSEITPNGGNSGSLDRAGAGGRKRATTCEIFGLGGLLVLAVAAAVFFCLDYLQQRLPHSVRAAWGDQSSQALTASRSAGGEGLLQPAAGDRAARLVGSLSLHDVHVLLLLEAAHDEDAALDKTSDADPNTLEVNKNLFSARPLSRFRQRNAFAAGECTKKYGAEERPLKPAETTRGRGRFDFGRLLYPLLYPDTVFEADHTSNLVSGPRAEEQEDADESAEEGDGGTGGRASATPAGNSLLKVTTWTRIVNSRRLLPRVDVPVGAKTTVGEARRMLKAVLVAQLEKVEQAGDALLTKTASSEDVTPQVKDGTSGPSSDFYAKLVKPLACVLRERLRDPAVRLRFWDFVEGVQSSAPEHADAAQTSSTFPTRVPEQDAEQQLLSAVLPRSKGIAKAKPQAAADPENVAELKLPDPFYGVPAVLADHRSWGTASGCVLRWKWVSRRGSPPGNGGCRKSNPMADCRVRGGATATGGSPVSLPVRKRNGHKFSTETSIAGLVQRAFASPGKNVSEAALQVEVLQMAARKSRRSGGDGVLTPATSIKSPVARRFASATFGAADAEESEVKSRLREWLRAVQQQLHESIAVLPTSPGKAVVVHRAVDGFSLSGRPGADAGALGDGTAWFEVVGSNEREDFLREKDLFARSSFFQVGSGGSSGREEEDARQGRPTASESVNSTEGGSAPAASAKFERRIAIGELWRKLFLNKDAGGADHQPLWEDINPPVSYVWYWRADAISVAAAARSRAAVSRVALRGTKIRGRRAPCFPSARRKSKARRECLFFRSMDGEEYKIPLRGRNGTELVREMEGRIVKVPLRWVRARKAAARARRVAGREDEEEAGTVAGTATGASRAQPSTPSSPLPRTPADIFAVKTPSSTPVFAAGNPWGDEVEGTQTSAVVSPDEVGGGGTASSKNVGEEEAGSEDESSTSADGRGMNEDADEEDDVEKMFKLAHRRVLRPGFRHARRFVKLFRARAKENGIRQAAGELLNTALSHGKAEAAEAARAGADLKDVLRDGLRGAWKGWRRGMAGRGQKKATPVVKVEDDALGPTRSSKTASSGNLGSPAAAGKAKASPKPKPTGKGKATCASPAESDHDSKASGTPRTCVPQDDSPCETFSGFSSEADKGCDGRIDVGDLASSSSCGSLNHQQDDREQLGAVHAAPEGSPPAATAAEPQPGNDFPVSVVAPTAAGGVDGLERNDRGGQAERGADAPACVAASAVAIAALAHAGSTEEEDASDEEDAETAAGHASGGCRDRAAVEMDTSDASDDAEEDGNSRLPATNTRAPPSQVFADQIDRFSALVAAEMSGVPDAVQVLAGALRDGAGEGASGFIAKFKEGLLGNEQPLPEQPLLELRDAGISSALARNPQQELPGTRGVVPVGEESSTPGGPEVEASETESAASSDDAGSNPLAREAQLGVPEGRSISRTENPSGDEESASAPLKAGDAYAAALIYRAAQCVSLARPENTAALEDLASTLSEGVRDGAIAFKSGLLCRETDASTSDAATRTRELRTRSGVVASVIDPANRVLREELSSASPALRDLGKSTRNMSFELLEAFKKGLLEGGRPEEDGRNSRGTRLAPAGVVPEGDPPPAKAAPAKPASAPDSPRKPGPDAESGQPATEPEAVRAAPRSGLAGTAGPVEMIVPAAVETGCVLLAEEAFSAGSRSPAGETLATTRTTEQQAAVPAAASCTSQPGSLADFVYSLVAKTGSSREVLIPLFYRIAREIRERLGKDGLHCLAAHGKALLAGFVPTLVARPRPGLLNGDGAAPALQTLTYESFCASPVDWIIQFARDENSLSLTESLGASLRGPALSYRVFWLPVRGMEATVAAVRGCRDFVAAGFCRVCMLAGNCCHVVVLAVTDPRSAVVGGCGVALRVVRGGQDVCASLVRPCIREANAVVDAEEIRAAASSPANEFLSLCPLGTADAEAATTAAPPEEELAPCAEVAAATLSSSTVCNSSSSSTETADPLLHLENHVIAPGSGGSDPSSARASRGEGESSGRESSAVPAMCPSTNPSRLGRARKFLRCGLQRNQERTATVGATESGAEQMENGSSGSGTRTTAEGAVEDELKLNAHDGDQSISGQKKHATSANEAPETSRSAGADSQTAAADAAESSPAASVLSETKDTATAAANATAEQRGFFRARASAALSSLRSGLRGVPSRFKSNSACQGDNSEAEPKRRPKKSLVDGPSLLCRVWGM